MAETTTTAAPTTTPSPQQQAADQQQQAAGAPGAPAPATSQYSRFSRDQEGASLDDLFNNVSEKDLVLRYPANLESEEHLHWVVFYPLIREKSNKKPRSSGASLQLYDGGGNNLSNEEAAKKAIVAGSVVAGFQTGAAAGMASQFLSHGGKANGTPADGAQTGMVAGLGKSLGGLATKFSEGLIGGAAGALGGKAIGEGYNALASNLSNVLIGDTSIALHISEKISTSYSANWDVADLGGLIAAVGSGSTGVMDALMSGDGADFVARKLGKLSSIVGGDQLQNVIEAGTKRVENPYKQQLFKSMGFRKFTFDYKFSPRNEEEARIVFGAGNEEVARSGGDYTTGGILYTFLRHMHPEKSDTVMFLEYPSEFLIVYYYQGKENQFVRKISNCALVNMAIDYGAEGMTSVYDTWGVPTECTIRLEFIELETLTGDRIQKGY